MTDNKPKARSTEHEPSGPTYRAATLRRFSPAKRTSVEEQVDVVVETFVTVTIEDAGRYVLVCSPSDTEALAVGFAFSEGLISSAEDIAHLGFREGDRTAVEMKLKDPGKEAPGRNLLMTSSCGACGTRNLEKYMTGELSVGSSLKIPSGLLLDVAREMRSLQGLFSKTGGTHAAAVFQGDGHIVAIAEDIGRHSALDKAIGKCLQKGISTKGCGAMLSGRMSFEIVAKAARAGLEILGAVSAPSSLAVDVAEQCRITICGFVREDRLSAYTHPGRLDE